MSRLRGPGASGALGAPASAALAGLALAVAVALGGCAAEPDPGPFVQPENCAAGTGVRTAGELADALRDAEPGAVIVLSAGRYAGSFTIATAGTAADPITLCGGPEAVLDGGSVDEGYTLHLDGAAHWQLQGFTVSGGQKGVMLDASSDNTLSGLTVTGVGDEGIHLRSGSSDNTVINSTVDGTGLREPRFGEGLYVGSAEGNWCTFSGCEADRSDRNRLIDNTVRGTTAEAIDVKEGTSGGEMSGNRLDGAAMSEADSLIDVKGNGWSVNGNSGTAPVDGAQVHVVVEGWGRENIFAANTFEVASDGYAVLLEGSARATANTVGCDNVASISGTPTPAAVTNGTCTR